jgi:hypothetical protein
MINVFSEPKCGSVHRAALELELFYAAACTPFADFSIDGH